MNDFIDYLKKSPKARIQLGLSLFLYQIFLLFVLYDFNFKKTLLLYGICISIFWFQVVKNIIVNLKASISGHPDPSINKAQLLLALIYLCALNFSLIGIFFYSHFVQPLEENVVPLDKE